MLKKMLLAIGLAVAIPAVIATIALAVSARTQPALQVKQTPSTLLQAPTGQGLGVPEPSQIQGGNFNVQAQ